MKTKTHITAATAAFLAMETTQQRLAQRRAKKWSRKPVAALLAGFLMAVLAPTAFPQSRVGSLFFIDSDHGYVQTGQIARNGVFSLNKVPQPYPSYLAPGMSMVVNTANGLLAYNPKTGEGQVVQIGADGLPVFQGHYWFTPGWTHIVSNGDSLLFYRNAALGGGFFMGDGTAAIGHITPDGQWVQRNLYVSGSFGRWTDIVATDNNLFFYNSLTGAGAVGYITAHGSLITTQTWAAGSLATYCHIVSDGQYLLFYQQTTGATWVGAIDMPGELVITNGVYLAAGYNWLVRQDRYFFFLHSGSYGRATIGYVDQDGKFRTTVADASLVGVVGGMIRRIVSTKDYLFFYGNYSYTDGLVARIDRNGQFQTIFGVGNFLSPSFSPWDQIAVTAR